MGWVVVSSTVTGISKGRDEGKRAEQFACALVSRRPKQNSVTFPDNCSRLMSGRRGIRKVNDAKATRIDVIARTTENGQSKAERALSSKNRAS